jgi:hypothetical protein
LIGQRWPAFVFMSAQQKCFWGIAAAALGRTGVSEARLIVRTANKDRAASFIGVTISQGLLLDKP